MEAEEEYAHDLGDASDGDGGHPATPRDAADEGPGAILQVIRNGVVAVFRREDAMNAKRDAGMAHVSGIYHGGSRVLPSLRDSALKFDSQPGTDVPGWVLASLRDSVLIRHAFSRHLGAGLGSAPARLQPAAASDIHHNPPCVPRSTVITHASR